MLTDQLIASSNSSEFESVTQHIRRAATAPLGLAQHTALDQVRDVAQRGVGRALGHGGPLAAGQFAFDAVEHAVEQFDLAFVHGRGGPLLPEACFAQHSVERLIDLIMMAILLGITVLLTYPELQKLLASTQSAPSGDEGGFPWLGVVGLLLGLAFWFLRHRFFETALGQRVQAFLRGLSHGFTSILRLNNPWAYLGHTAFIWGAYFVMVYVCFFAMPATEHIDIEQGLFVMIAASLGVVVPVPGGVGAYHYLVAKALEVLSIPYVEGLAFATLVHASQALMLMSTGVIGFIGLSRFKND